jgi:hypothetical protein
VVHSTNVAHSNRPQVLANDLYAEQTMSAPDLPRLRAFFADGRPMEVQRKGKRPYVGTTQGFVYPHFTVVRENSSKMFDVRNVGVYVSGKQRLTVRAVDS